MAVFKVHLSFSVFIVLCIRRRCLLFLVVWKMIVDAMRRWVTKWQSDDGIESRFGFIFYIARGESVNILAEFLGVVINYNAESLLHHVAKTRHCCCITNIMRFLVLINDLFGNFNGYNSWLLQCIQGNNC